MSLLRHLEPDTHVDGVTDDHVLCSNVGPQCPQRGYLTLTPPYIRLRCNRARQRRDRIKERLPLIHAREPRSIPRVPATDGADYLFPFASFAVSESSH